MRVSIVGTGYVGLVTGACFAERGVEVLCVDVDRSKVDAINARRAPIHEAGLPALLERHVGTRLRATADLAAAVAETDVTFIAVGTPAVNGRIDLRYVERAAAEIGAALREKRGWHAVVVKSTVVPGTTDGPVLWRLEEASGKRAGRDFGLGMNPEFLTEGQAVADFLAPDRIVLGALDARTHELLQELYASFADTPKIVCNTRTAEAIKYASNALLATMISFSNEIGRLCSRVGGVDVADVLRGVHASAYLTTRKPGAEPVIAPIASFLEAGCGFGGSCLPKDVAALVAQADALELELPVLRSVLAVNATQPDELVRLVTRHYPDLAGVRVAVLGLAFKPETDDLRESPAFPILRRLRAAGAALSAYDPVARPESHPDLCGVRLAPSLEAALADAEVVVLVTRWAEFAAVPEVLRRLGRTPLLVDGRRVIPPQAVTRYEGIGR